MYTKLFRRLEIAGVPVVFLLATLLHGLYDLTGQSVLGALLGAVNESVWEHLKIFAIAYLFWAVVELLWARPPFRRFLVSKVVGVVALCILLAVFFYGYTYFTKESYLVLDIASAIVFTVFAQFLSFRLLESGANLEQYFYTAVMLLVLVFVMLLCFSYYPPKNPIFRDPVTGGYGVAANPEDLGAQVLSREIYGEAVHKSLKS